MNFDERVRRKNEFDGNLVYGTKQFNLLTGRHRHLGYRQKHDNQWINAKKGLIHNKFAEKRRCPLCGADYFDTLFLKEGFPHQKCRVCELVYVSPILNREVYMRWSRNERTYVSVLKTKVQTKMQTLKSIYILDILRLYLNKRSVVDVCDIGCGPGVLLSEAKKRKYNAFGIEPNKKCHKLLEKKGIDYTRDFFPLKEYGRKKFDCVFLLNVLEHMRNPVEMAKATKKILKTHGLIYISVPNIDALVNRVMREKGATFGGHSHIQFFNVKTLSMLLEKAGFEIKEYDTVITELGTINNYLSFKDPYFAENADMLEFITPEAIYKNYLGSSLHMIGKLR